MSQNSTSINGLSNESMGGVNPGSNHHVTAISCTPPPSYHNINLPPGHPAVLINDRGAPPSYEDVIDPNAPPPSYDSLFGRMREAHKASKGVFDFLLNIVVLLLGTIGCTIIIGVTIVVPICMMVIGGIYLYDCPQGEYIPVYLLVGGGFGVFKQLLHLSARVRKRQEERDEERMRQTPTQTLINCFMLGWFIIGSMWVYKEYEPNYDPSRGKYCNKTLYLFAFWLITCVYIVLGLITAGLCSISVASIAFQRRPPDLM
ncbi:transmembrane protein 272-like [Venturia canescens]|uniref:transmembrane protein 272-like n=1 Tax=Venturia canescens TaxID=32260 RepID=UPI001C9C82F4|nr:transmembrane protein 272-like [Venturia canescens]XP_043278539.1 transmembrane protein 272-like [Venturia canescens]